MHGSFREPLPNADAFPMCPSSKWCMWSADQHGHCKTVQACPSALHGNRALWIPFVKKTKWSAKPSTAQRFKPFPKRSYIGEFSRDEWKERVVHLLISISERAKLQFGISVFDEIADVVRVFERCGVFPSRFQHDQHRNESLLNSPIKKTQKLTEITMNHLSKNIF